MSWHELLCRCLYLLHLSPLLRLCYLRQLTSFLISYWFISATNDSKTWLAVKQGLLLYPQCPSRSPKAAFYPYLDYSGSACYCLSDWQTVLRVDQRLECDPA